MHTLLLSVQYTGQASMHASLTVTDLVCKPLMYSVKPESDSWSVSQVLKQ